VIISESIIRITLRLSFVFNLIAAYLVAVPGSMLAQFAGFTLSSSAMHTGLAALMVAALGLAYGWMAQQPVINRPMLAFGGLVKASAFTLFVAQWFFDAVTGRFVLFAVVDIVLAIIWLSWLLKTRQ